MTRTLARGEKVIVERTALRTDPTNHIARDSNVGSSGFFMLANCTYLPASTYMHLCFFPKAGCLPILWRTPATVSS